MENEEDINNIFSMESDAYLKLTTCGEINIMYYPERNIYIGEGGYPIKNVFEFVTPNDLLLFKELSTPEEVFVIPGSTTRSTVLIHTYIEGQCYCLFCSDYDVCMGDDTGD